MLCARCAGQDKSVHRPDGAGTGPAYRTPAVIDKSKAEVANVLALVALPALGVAFLAAWSVLGNSAFAVKFENGVVPPGTDIASAQTAAWITIGALVRAAVDPPTTNTASTDPMTTTRPRRRRGVVGGAIIVRGPLGCHHADCVGWKSDG